MHSGVKETAQSISLFTKKHGYRLNSFNLQWDWVPDHHVDLSKFLNTVIAIKSSYCIILSYFKQSLFIKLSLSSDNSLAY